MPSAIIVWPDDERDNGYIYGPDHSSLSPDAISLYLLGDPIDYQPYALTIDDGGRVVSVVVWYDDGDWWWWTSAIIVMSSSVAYGNPTYSLSRPWWLAR